MNQDLYEKIAVQEKLIEELKSERYYARLRVMELSNENDLLKDRIKELERVLDEVGQELDEAKDKMGILADMEVQPNDSH